MKNKIDHEIYEHVYFIVYNVDTLENMKLDLTKKIIEQSLNIVIKWYAEFLQRNNLLLDNDRLETVLPQNLKFQDFCDMYEIDKQVLREDLIAPPEITFQWYTHNIFTHIAIRSSKTNSIVGYFTILPITDSLFEQIQQGNFKDNDLSTAQIRQYNMPDFYKLYIAAIGIHPEYQNTNALGKLLHAAINMMYDLAVEREVYITDIITEASTEQGARLCNIFKLKKLKDTSLNTTLYVTSLLPPCLQLHNYFGKRLIEFYKQKYEEMKKLISY